MVGRYEKIPQKEIETARKVSKWLREIVGPEKGIISYSQCLIVFYLHEAGWVAIPGSQIEFCLPAAIYNLAIQLHS